jgi:hypothetical protein
MPRRCRERSFRMPSFTLLDSFGFTDVIDCAGDVPRQPSRSGQRLQSAQ